MRDDIDDAVARAHENLVDAVTGLDEGRLLRTASQVLEECGSDVLVADLLVPVLRKIGELWQEGTLSIMHEHFASSAVRSAVGQIRRPVPPGPGLAVVLGCPPGELHDLPVHLFAVMLMERGITPVVLGANSPLRAVAHAARQKHAQACVLVARRERFALAYSKELRYLARSHTVFIAGPAAAKLNSARPPIASLPDDWRAAADTIAQYCQQASLAPGKFSPENAANLSSKSATSPTSRRFP